MSLLLVLLLASADAGSDAPRALSVRSAVVHLDDGGVAVVDGGVWLRDDVAEAWARAAEAGALRQVSPSSRPLAESVLSVVAAVLTALVVALVRPL